MRKGLFAIVLVAASFAGGATVNGPGLRWVRDVILNQPGTEITTTTLGDPAPDPASEPGSGGGVAPVAEIPSRPIPPLVIPSEASASAPSAPSQAVTAKADPAPPWPPAPAPPRPMAAAEPQEKAPGVKPPAASIPIAAVSPSAFEPPAPLPTLKDRDVGAASQSPIAAAPVDPDVNLAALPLDSGPPRLETPADPAPAPGVRVPDDWAAMRRKMRALGVARYGIEGEPDGRVRFHCVIPLAGRRAVGQQFEAEGADEIEAAQTALRRVALWRATEHPAATSPSPSPSAPAPAP